MAKEKSTKSVGGNEPERLRYAGYPSVVAYKFEYPQKRVNDKPVFEVDEKGIQNKDKIGKPIPVLDETKPKQKKKAPKNSELPWGFAVKDTGERYESIEGAKNVVYALCRRANDSKGGFESRDHAVWIREDKLQDNRCLEVVFVDIGQGDGCFLITPEGKKMVIDAGEASNMRHYLNWRYGSSNSTTFEAAVITHPDADHYKGFEKLFERENFYFETIYTNGLMEQVESKEKPKKGEPKSTGLGPVSTIKDGKKNVEYVTDLVTSKKELQAFLGKPEKWKNRQFPTMLNNAFEGRKLRETRSSIHGEKSHVSEVPGKTMGDFRMLSVDDEYMPGYKPIDTSTPGWAPKSAKETNGKPVPHLEIKVLGPITMTVDGKKMLQWLDGNISKTKNGHSVVLRLQYGNVSMMLGGDLNIPSEELLLRHHTGLEVPDESTSPTDTAAFEKAARQVFQVDIAKSCHHGSSDFSHWFLRALNPLATVISSGDDEPHSHPRSDTLGAIGHFSRCDEGSRPLIFSTELARSTKDDLQKPWELRAEIMDKVETIVNADSETKREQLMEKLKEQLKKDIDRSVAVYGAIWVVTDGEKVIIYQKLEQKGSHGEYDIYCLEPSAKDPKGPLTFKPKH